MRSSAAGAHLWALAAVLVASAEVVVGWWITAADRGMRSDLTPFIAGSIVATAGFAVVAYGALRSSKLWSGVGLIVSSVAPVVFFYPLTLVSLALGAALLVSASLSARQLH